MDKQAAAAFKLSVPEADIADLRERLSRTRLPDQAPGPAWQYGTDVAWLRKLIDYWRDD
jgi:Epoxide hydrolase N terminus